MYSRQPTRAIAKTRRPRALWLALLLAIFSALAPTVSHALNWTHGDSGRLIEVGTSAGPRWMALLQAPDSDGLSDASLTTQPVSDAPTPGQMFEHCPFCLLLAERAAPPPTSWPVDFVAPGQALAPVSAPQLFLPTFTAPTPPPRGPPPSV
jgi:hypothetical protein